MLIQILRIINLCVQGTRLKTNELYMSSVRFHAQLSTLNTDTWSSNLKGALQSFLDLNLGLILRCRFSRWSLRNQLQTITVQAGGHHLMTPTEPHHLWRAPMRSWDKPLTMAVLGNSIRKNNEHNRWRRAVLSVTPMPTRSGPNKWLQCKPLRSTESLLLLLSVQRIGLPEKTFILIFSHSQPPRPVQARLFACLFSLKWALHTH